MNNSTKKMFEEFRSDVSSGKMLPYQYVEQCHIASAEGKINHNEFIELSARIPFCPALIDGAVR